MLKLLLWILKTVYKTVPRETLAPVAPKYVIAWLPKPDFRQITTMLSGLEFKFFMEHCQKKGALLVAVQKSNEARAEQAILLEGIHMVEQWAKEYVEKNRKPAEDVPDDTMSLEPEALVREYDLIQEARNE